MTWQNRLVKKEVSDSPVVEQTPVIWEGKLLIVETWQTHWDGAPPSERQFYVRIRDEQSGEIICRLMDGFGFSSAFVWKDRMYVYATKCAGGVDADQSIYMSSSENLTDWSESKLVIKRDDNEQLDNQSVCYDGKRFVMAYETNAYSWFTLKFAESDDLINWRKVPNALYGAEKYAACPAIRYTGGYYYMLYLEYRRPKWWLETCVTRSKDLTTWMDAPHDRPVIVPDGNTPVHPDCPCPKHDDRADEISEDVDLLFLPMLQQEPICPANGKECNTSDPDLVEWQGKTRVYFTGGCQHWGGLLQYAEFDGPMQKFFESYYE